MIKDAVNVLLIDPIANAVSGPGARSGAATSEAPTPSDQASAPSRTTPAATPGDRHSRCLSRTFRESDSTSAGSTYGRPRAPVAPARLTPLHGIEDVASVDDVALRDLLNPRRSDPCRETRPTRSAASSRPPRPGPRRATRRRSAPGARRRRSRSPAGSKITTSPPRRPIEAATSNAGESRMSSLFGLNAAPSTRCGCPR